MDTHQYAPDPDLPVCARCGMPRPNRCHATSDALPPVTTPVARVRHDAPATSVRAAAAALPRTGTIRAEIVDLIGRSPAGLTDDDLERITGRSHQSVSAARNSLVRDGWLTPASGPLGPVVRPTRFGNDATVWVLSAQARQVWAA